MPQMPKLGRALDAMCCSSAAGMTYLSANMLLGCSLQGGVTGARLLHLALPQQRQRGGRFGLVGPRSVQALLNQPVPHCHAWGPPTLCM